MVPVIELPSDRMLTWDDLQAIPDEAHHHYELIEGQILVSPSPGLLHQRCVLRLCAVLADAAPRELEVIVSPFDFAPELGTVLQPDILVVRRGTTEVQRTVRAPLLVVEVVSRSSRTTDRITKRELYARFGVEHYWIVDPSAPSILAFELGDGPAYVEVSRAQGDTTFVAERPVSVAVPVAQLVAD